MFKDLKQADRRPLLIDLLKLELKSGYFFYQALACAHFLKVTKNDRGFESLFKCSKDLLSCEMSEVNET